MPDAERIIELIEAQVPHATRSGTSGRADPGLGQVMDENQQQGMRQVDLVLQVRCNDEGHQEHHPAMLGDAFLSAVRQPGVAQFRLQPLSQGEEVKHLRNQVRFAVRTIRHGHAPLLRTRNRPSGVLRQERVERPKSRNVPSWMQRQATPAGSPSPSNPVLESGTEQHSGRRQVAQARLEVQGRFGGEVAPDCGEECQLR